MSGQVDALYIYLLLVAGVMTALIFVAVTVLAIKYRRVPGREATQIEGSTILEITWSIIPFFVMLTFSFGEPFSIPGAHSARQCD